MTDTGIGESTPAARPVHPAYGYPTEERYRPRGWVRHLAGVATSPAAVPAARVALERAAGRRAGRLREAAAQGLARRRRPLRRMRALMAYPGGRLRWRDVPAPPSPGPDAAVVHPVAVATCDLDRAMGLGMTPFVLPFRFGHECVAEVTEVGERVTSVRPGDRVVVPFQISCGTCERCRAGLTGNCATVPPISMYGFGVIGGHWGGVLADLVTVPYADGMLVPLPDGIEPATAASVADNVTDGYRCIAPHLPGILAREPDTDVLLLTELGRGLPLSASAALYAGLTARALGARRVHLVDRREHVRRHAEALGLIPHPPRELRGLPPMPLVYEASATARGLAAAIDKTAPDGVCVSAASLRAHTRFPTAAMYGRNITYHLARSHARANIPAVLDLISSGALDPSRVTSHLGSLDTADRAIAEHLRGEATKTIVVE
ncbi:zinc-dependent alcohol dehydrogenase [Nocardioides cheoyonin]|uniref:zinc-dependent alcohol dehydrogenase n=1 Tax=Nocardioides cheoyonin TaxID=3156615 RepID=UPI0032B59A27